MKKYVQITAGRGPVECARAVAIVAREMLKGRSGLELVEAEEHNTQPGCYMSMTFLVDGEDAEISAMQREWEGSVLYRSTSNPFRPGHKRRNWFVGVAFIDPLDLPEVCDRDIAYEFSRAGGKGGQNVNKVETSVRAIHLPTGVSVRCGDERSQSQNRSRARERLLLKLREMRHQRVGEEEKDAWRNHTTLERGNPVKTLFGQALNSRILRPVTPRRGFRRCGTCGRSWPRLAWWQGTAARPA